MNNIRDPFSIRNKPSFSPAFQLLRQQSLQHAAHLSAEVQKTTVLTVQNAAQSVQHAAQTVHQAVLPAVELASDALEQMSSFSIPGNVPSFSAASRHLENQNWGARFGQKDLPLYKDKPYYSNSATGRRRIMRRKRFVALIVVLLLAAWWLGVFSFDGVKLPDSIKSGGPRAQSAVNWDERREKVKEAFVDSWAAYERDAWGNRPHPTISIFGLTASQARISTAPSASRARTWARRAWAGSLSTLSTP